MADAKSLYKFLVQTGELNICDGLKEIEKDVTKSFKKIDVAGTDKIWIFSCPAGAYNMYSALIFEPYRNKNKRVLSFAMPEFNEDGRMIGMTSQVMVPELSFEKKANGSIEFKSLQKIRGLGDLYELATFTLETRDCCAPQLILYRYERDRTKDDVKNPEILFGLKSGERK